MLHDYDLQSCTSMPLPPLLLLSRKCSLLLSVPGQPLLRVVSNSPMIELQPHAASVPMFVHWPNSHAFESFKFLRWSLASRAHVTHCLHSRPTALGAWLFSRSGTLPWAKQFVSYCRAVGIFSGRTAPNHHYTRCYPCQSPTGQCGVLAGKTARSDRQGKPHMELFGPMPKELLGFKHMKELSRDGRVIQQ